MLSIGLYKAEIVQNDLREIGDKTAVELQVQTEAGDTTNVLIFITEKSAGIARAQLKVCGFDPDTHDLQMLADDPTLLAGASIPILVEEYNGKLRAQITLHRRPEQEKAKRLTGILRSAKKSGPDPAHEPPPPSDSDIPF